MWDVFLTHPRVKSFEPLFRNIVISGDNLLDSSRDGGYSVIKHLAMIAAGAQWSSVLLAMLTAYFDASGKQIGQSCMAMAGFIAKAEHWIDFEKQWLERLAKDELSCFHAHDVRRLPQFKNDASRLASLYADLIEIIRGTVLRKIGCAITTKAIESISQEERREWNICAYSLVGRACVGQVRIWLSTWGGSLPEFVFEDGDEGRGALMDVMSKDGFPKPIFKPKKDRYKNGFLEKGLVPLQAADLLAYEYFDPIRKIETDGYLERIRPSLKAFDSIPGEPKHIPLELMKQIRRLAVMEDDKLWLPEGPDDKPLAGL